jgi:hypothetical protein
MQRNGSHILSDRLQCPDCDGTGRQFIGPLELACRFCGGSGYVGNDNEPAEDRVGEPQPMQPVWQEPATRTLAVCRVCFGAQKVVNLGGTGEPTGYLIELPCPKCSKQAYED